MNLVALVNLIVAKNKEQTVAKKMIAPLEKLRLKGSQEPNGNITSKTIPRFLEVAVDQNGVNEMIFEISLSQKQSGTA
jgi:uncharacterized protein YdeI (YjbR/CyaY-like superfamily)